MNKKPILAVFIFFILLTVFSLRIPFFWDGTFFSMIAAHFSTQGFNGFIATGSYDTGGFPLFSAYLATAWKCFGDSLTVSHWAMLPFLFGIAREYFKFAKRWLYGPALVFAMILLCIEPVFITQSILMGYDVAVTYFFLLSLNALLDKKKFLFSAALIFLCMISVRGMMLAAALFAIDFILNRKNGYTFIKNYIPAAVALIAWICYHHYKTGWYVFSPDRAANAEAFSEPGMILRQIGYIVWKNLDLGRISLWLTLLVGHYYFFRKSDEGKQLIKVILVPLLTLAVFMCLIKNPIAQKYFMTVFLLLNVGACAVIQQLGKRNMQNVIFLSLCVSLICGNFILYPQRYGNAWDSSLKVLPYFSMQQEMDDYINSKAIAPEMVATQFPLSAESKPSQRAYTDLEDHPSENYMYFLYSNIINTNRIDELEKIKNTWIKEKALKRGQVILILFRNPASLQNEAPVLALKDQGSTGRPLPGMAKP
jgi:hypothetical protein